MIEIAEKELSRLGIGESIKKMLSSFLVGKNNVWPLPVP